MKVIRVLFAPVLILFVSSLLNSATAPKVYKMDGTLNEKIKIHMDLSIKGKTVTGTYFYLSQNKPIPLSGTYNPETFEVLIKEMDQGKVTGQFAGTLYQNEYSGTWMNPENTKFLPFKLCQGKCPVDTTEGSNAKPDDYED